MFADIATGRERWGANYCIARHRHGHAYAAIILSGGYEECGNRGRFRVGPGDVLLHDAFDAHVDRFGGKGAQILNLVIPDWSLDGGAGHVADPDTIARAAERDMAEALALLRAQLCQAAPAPENWHDNLARALLADPDCGLGEWAQAHNLTPESISRGFGRLFGVTPATFRAEVRAHRAFALIRRSNAPLAEIAMQAGFADQAHMSRAVRALTGAPPGQWRRSNQFKTARPVAI